jgi:hypothetical protein
LQLASCNTVVFAKGVVEQIVYKVSLVFAVRALNGEFSVLIFTRARKAA